jgi:hypothetical protein
MDAQLDSPATMEFFLVWHNEIRPTYHIDGNLKFPSTVVQNTSVVNNNIQSLKCCVCFLERLCNTNKIF